MTDATPPAGRYPWAELLRLPNLFTVPGEAVAGFVLAAGAPAARAGWACAAVLLVYAGGLLLNDWFDREQDAAERPQRPLPSGRVRPESARNAGYVALLAGACLAWATGPAPAGLAATATAACALVYDAGGKRTAAGPGLMGLCRAGALLVGAGYAQASAAGYAPASAAGYAGAFPVPVVVAAVTVFAYTAMLTYAARGEAAVDQERKSSPGADAWTLPVILVCGGLAMALWTGRYMPGAAFLGLGAVEAAWVAHRLRAGAVATPAAIGRLVRVMITVQAAWALWPVHRVSTLAALAALFVALRAGAEAAGRAFYGS